MDRKIEDKIKIFLKSEHAVKLYELNGDSSRMHRTLRDLVVKKVYECIEHSTKISDGAPPASRVPCFRALFR